MKDALPPFGAGELPPKGVAWLHPVQLLRTAYHVWLSTTAKEYVDRRETLAALDQLPVPRECYPVSSLIPLSTYDAELSPRFLREGIWIDYVADVGDSWNATFAVSKLIVTPKLTPRGHVGEPLPAASWLVLGGDLVYPTPSRDAYRRKLRSALIGALPGWPDPPPDPRSELDENPAPNLFAIPGNHDWYDGLTNFVREFCQGGRIGGWFLAQRRSYFAVRLTPGWWLWGIDIALDTRIDPPQQAYFHSILRGERGTSGHTFQEHDNIILCTAKPAWLEGTGAVTEAHRNLSFFVREVERNKGCVRVILAGDMHHYSRYENSGGDQLITAGGGGAYLSGTHQLPSQVPDLWARAHESDPVGVAAGTGPKPEDAFRAAGHPYPSRKDSRLLALRGMLLALRPANWPFAVFVGLLYWLFVWALRRGKVDPLSLSLRDLMWFPVNLTLSPSVTVAFVVAATMLASAVTLAAAANRSQSRVLTVVWGMLHGFLHMVLALLVAREIYQWAWPDRIAAMLPFDNAGGVVFAVSVILIGGFAGATLVGIYLTLSDMVLGWHTNEVFASLSIFHYRNFLRIHVLPDGSLKIYPIGLRRTPRKWRYAREREDHEPYYEPTDRVLLPHLIEGPLTITRRGRPRPIV